VKTVGSLELDEDMRFQRWSWAAQRVAWAAMAVTLVAACVGLLGPGPASKRRARAGDGSLTVEYSARGHANAEAEFNLILAPGVATGGVARLNVGAQIFEKIRIEATSPEPESVSVSQEGLVYQFRVADPAQQAKIVLYAKTTTWGRVNASMGLAGREAVPISILIFP
jgi:hypothetical protein